MLREAKIALAREGLVLQDVADKVGLSMRAVAHMFDPNNPYQGYAYRAKVAQVLKVAPKALWGEDWQEPKRRQPATKRPRT